MIIINLHLTTIYLTYNNKLSENFKEEFAIMRAQKKNNDADYTVKIVIVGDSGIGKTNILCRFCDN